MSRFVRMGTAGVVCALLVLSGGAATAAAAPGDVSSVDLSLLASHNLASAGHDGAVKPRGQNGDLAVSGDMVYVAGGARFHGAQSTPGRVCTDYGGVKVVDVSDPENPDLRSTIDIADEKTVISGPVGNPRRLQSVKNVSASVSAVSVIDHPVADKKVLAIATQRCEQSFFNGARIEFWDVSDPENPAIMGDFDPEDILNPNCTPGTPPVCPPGTPANGAWGIFEDVRMFTRDNGPGGSTKVYAVATSPFSIGNSHDASPQGDFRLLDVTNPASPQQVDNFPKTSIGQDSHNGCRVFQAGRSAAPTPDGSHAILSWYDGALPADTTLAGPNTAALFNLDLDNLPQFTGGGPPKAFSPNPPTWGFPVGSAGGMTPGGQVEGNAADVQPFLGPGGSLMSFMSEEDVDPALTSVTIDGPASAAHTSRACETMFANKLHQRPGQQLVDDVAYVGRGCPGSPLAKSRLRGADPYVEDPAGKIALFESGGDGFDGCSGGAKIKRAVAAGATGVIFNIGGNLLNLIIPGPDGGIPAVPTVGVQLDAFNKMVGFVPSRILSGVAFPTTYERTLATTAVTTSAATPGGANTMSVNALPAALPAGTVVQFPKGPAPGVVQVIVRLNTAAGATSLPVEAVTGAPATEFLPTNTTGNVSNVTVQPIGLAVTGATNASPIAITTASHNLRTGDRVTLDDVGGNTAANGSWTVTVTSSTTFTLNGSVGNGTWATANPPGVGANGGFVRPCPPADPSCSAESARTDISRFRSVADATDRNARGRVIQASRFNVTAGESYKATGRLEVASRVDGNFEASVAWYDAGNAELSRSAINTPLTAVTPRTRYDATVTAPAGAVKGGIVFEWTGASAEGVAYADTFTLVPNNLSVTLKDNQGEWGAQRIIDFSQPTPTLAGTYRSPRSLVWPPPNDGVYSPRQARMAGNDLALTTWMSDGLRVLDVKNPSAPKEVGSFVPPDVDDPSPAAGAGPTNLRDPPSPDLLRGQSWPDRALVTGVGYIPQGTDAGIVVISDINAGLYVLQADIKREVAQTPGGTPPPPPPPPAAQGDNAKPDITALRVRPNRLRRGDALPKLGVSSGRRITFTLSEDATVTLKFDKRTTGRSVGGTCRRTTSANRNRPKCTRYVNSGSRQVDAKKGDNSLRFQGRLRASKRLTLGRYRLSATARDGAGNPQAKARTKLFRHVRP